MKKTRLFNDPEVKKQKSKSCYKAEYENKNSSVTRLKDDNIYLKVKSVLKI